MRNQYYVYTYLHGIYNRILRLAMIYKTQYNLFIADIRKNPKKFSQVRSIRRYSEVFSNSTFYVSKTCSKVFGYSERDRKVCQRADFLRRKSLNTKKQYIINMLSGFRKG